MIYMMINVNKTGENIAAYIPDEEKDLTPKMLQEVMESKNFTFDTVAEVKQDDVRFYLFDPWWLSEKQIAKVKEIYAQLHK